MAVGVHGQRDLAVTGDLHHHARRPAFGDQESPGRRMAQVVQPDGRQARSAKQLLELPVVLRGSTGVVNTQKLPRQSEPAETED